VRTLLAFALVFCASFAHAAESPAKIDVGGYGLIGNRRLVRAIRLLQKEKKAPPFYDANLVEDGALLVISTLTREGYLSPKVTAHLTLADGKRVKYEFDSELTTTLPRSLQVKHAVFRIRRGVLYYYANLEFTGFKKFRAGEAKKYFIEPEFLFAMKASRIYTPALLSKSIRNLSEAYTRKGFQDVKVTLQDLKRDDKTGAIRATIHVEEGLPSFVRSVHTEIFAPGEQASLSTTNVTLHKPYSKFWAQDYEQKLKAQQYAQGYPDARASLTVTNRETGAKQIELDLVAHVQTGPLIHVGAVRFAGNTRTQTSVIDSRVQSKPGETLNRIQVEDNRLHLARLGAFESVVLRYEEVDEKTRDVRYDFTEGKTLDISLLFGYGSYEMLRGGVELAQHNLWGLAHESRLRLRQSFKASGVDYLYTIPAFLFGDDMNFFTEAAYLRREEVSFLRQEYGGSVGAQRHVRLIDSDVSLRYTFQSLNASITESNLPRGVEHALVGAVVLDVRHDRRDNPLVPRRGYNIFSDFEFASTALGGEVDYQRVQLAGSYHVPLGGGRYLHLGLRHGGAFTSGNGSDLPFNKRFFPGGENSVRGFQEGEAAPRNDDGKIIGAACYLQGNFEFEQYLTPTWSIVTFIDGVGFAEDIGNYPYDETLYSVGGGLRWKTVVGPIRVEYGYNPKRRPQDPVGTLHFSLGFPF